MCFERPQEEAVARKELVAKRLAIAGAGPELLAASAPPQCAREEPREDRGKWRVDPNHGVGARPNQIARTATGVVPIDHPSVAFDRARDALLEYVDWYESPVRTPRERVELDVTNAEPTRQLTRECRLTRARRSDDRDAPAQGGGAGASSTSPISYDLLFLFLGFWAALKFLMRSATTSA